MESVSEHATEVAKESWPSQRSKVPKDRDSKSKSKSESRFTKVQKHYQHNGHAKVRAQVSEFMDNLTLVIFSYP